jgi:hypothetical protein
MGLSIGGFQLPDIKLPKLDLGAIGKEVLSKGVDILKGVAKDMFAPSADGKTIFNKNVDVNILGSNVRLPNPIEILSEKLLGAASTKLKDIGVNVTADQLQQTIGSMRQVKDAGQVEMPALAERSADYKAMASGGGTTSTSAATTATSTSPAAAAIAAGGDIAPAFISASASSLNKLDSQVNGLMDQLMSGKELSSSDMQKLTILMQQRSQLMDMISKITSMEAETKRNIIANMR